MDQIFETVSSPGFRGVMYNLSILCLLLAVAITVFAFAFYGRGREASGEEPDNGKWVLLFASWRDSLIITLLFAAQGMAYRFGDFANLSEQVPSSVLLFSPVVMPVLIFVLDLLILIVAATRILALSKWLSSRIRKTPS